jgi:hypothetical protein
MKKTFLYFFVAALSLFTVGCQKELSVDSLNGGPGGGSGGGGGNSALIGTWKFLELSAKTEADVRVSDGVDTERALTRSEYTTKNNKGTVSFDGSKMISSGVGYDIDATAMTYLFSNGVLIDSLDFPFTFSIPSSSGETKYKVIGSDSLYFESGFFTVPGTNPQASQASGAKYKIEGNIMTMTTASSNSVTQTQQGITTTQNNKITGVIKLQKQ